MQDSRPACWAYLPPPALDCCFAHLGSTDLAACSAACRGWNAQLCGGGTGSSSGSGAAWAAALEREFGCSLERQQHQQARQQLIAARTSTHIFVSGCAFPGLAGTPQSSRFTSPERLLLLEDSAHAGGAAGCDGSDDAESKGSTASLATSASAPVPRSRGLGSRGVSVRSLAAGADFAVLLTWDGRVLDTRCCCAAPAGGSANGRGSLDWRGLWQPPCTRAVSVATGGCWQGSGRPGGHVLVVTDQHTVWAWGANAAGQLGLGSRGNGTVNTGGPEGNDGPAAAAPAAAGAAAVAPAAAAGAPPLPPWVAAPLEVVDSALAGCLGYPVAAACGEEHSALLSCDGRLFAAGSNAAGACGLPVVQLASSAFAPVPLPAGEAATAVSCGGRNTAVATARGRLLVCGANDVAQAAVGRAGGCIYLLADCGPSADWHGMQRSNQQSSGGGGEAAARVAAAAVGCGSMYALTDCGDAFSWGQGGQGELGLGGNSRTVATPSRLPWARGATQLSASCGGRFAALVDFHCRLFTFGAGKSGALGHGDTAKRAVGRQVKALAGHAVHAVACGSDWMLVVCGWRPHAGKAGRGAGGSAKPAAPRLEQPAAGGGAAGTGPVGTGAAAAQSTPQQGGFTYKEVDPEPPSPRSSPRYRRNQEWQQHDRDASSLLPGNMPSTPRSNRGAGASEASSSQGAWLRGRSGREQRREWEEKEEQQQQARRRRGGRGRRRGGGLPELPDAAPEAVMARRQRWTAEPPATACPITPRGSDSGSECDEGMGRREGRGGGSGGGKWVDRQMAHLRRQLKAFGNDPRQRMLVFPKSFSSRDRWKVHLMAESWGLMHESHGEGGQRKLVVWKPSRNCKSLKPSMLEGWSSSSEGEDEGSSVATAADDRCADGSFTGPPTCSTTGAQLPLVSGGPSPASAPIGAAGSLTPPLASASGL